MDNTESGKDTDLENQSLWTRIQAVSHFFIGSGTWLLILVLAYVIGLAADLPFDALIRMEPGPGGFIYLWTNFLVSTLPFFLAAVLIPLVFRSNPSVYLRMASWPQLRTILLLVLFFIGLQPLTQILLQLNESIDLSRIAPEWKNWFEGREHQSNKMYEFLLGDKLDGSIFLKLIFFGIAPAIAEEFFFRGFMLRVMHGAFKNFHVANFVTSILFAAVHFQFSKVLPMVMLSMAFGYAFYFSRSIWIPVLLHAINNAITTILVLSYNQGDYEEMLGEMETYPWYVSVVAAGATIFIFLLLNRSKQDKLKSLYE